MKEIWKPIIGYDSYNISSFGRVKRNKRKILVTSNKRGKRYKYIASYKEKILKPLLSRSKKYYEVCLYKEKRGHYKLIHRLVAKHFIKNPKNKCCVNHKDGNKLNNYLGNLEWVTSSENSMHAHKIGLIQEDQNCCEKNGRTSLTNRNVLEIKQLLNEYKRHVKYIHWLRKDLAEIYSVSIETISRIDKNHFWKKILNQL